MGIEKTVRKEIAIADHLQEKILKTIDNFFRDNNKKIEGMDAIQIAFTAIPQSVFSLLKMMDRKNNFHEEITITMVHILASIESMQIKIREDNLSPAH